MSSVAEVYQKRLNEELSKPFPDQDIVYALEVSKPYWNIIDRDKVRRGWHKIASKPIKQKSKEQ